MSDQGANSQRNAKGTEPFADSERGSALLFWAQARCAPTTHAASRAPRGQFPPCSLARVGVCRPRKLSLLNPAFRPLARIEQADHGRVVHPWRRGRVRKHACTRAGWEAAKKCHFLAENGTFFSFSRRAFRIPLPRGSGSRISDGVWFRGRSKVEMVEAERVRGFQPA
jgi:hypothetical protein